MSAIPFGKHRGKDLSQVDDAYVAWLLTCDLKKNGFLQAVVTEATRRGLDTSNTAPAPRNQKRSAPAPAQTYTLATFRVRIDDVHLLRELIELGGKALEAELRPDHRRDAATRLQAEKLVRMLIDQLGGEQ